MADTDGGESFLDIHTESSSTEAAVEDGKRRLLNRPSFNPRERGAIEVKLAERFGPSGFDILSQLASIDDSVIDRLCQAFVEGALSERDVAAAHLAARQC